jgi:hypothetical protein
MIRVDRDVRIGEKNFEAGAPLTHIVQSLDKRISRREALALMLSIDPFKEKLD